MSQGGCWALGMHHVRKTDHALALRVKSTQGEMVNRKINRLSKCQILMLARK